MINQTCPTVLALDVDGVVVHTESGASSEWYANVADDLGVDPAELLREFFEPHWPAIIVGRADLRATLEPVLRKLEPGLSVDTFVKYWFEKHSFVDDAVIREVRYWSRSTCGRTVLVTNQEKYRAQYLWNVVGLRRHFDEMIWSGQLGVTKSKADFFHRASHLLVVPPPAVLYFDDDEGNVRVAAESGWVAYRYHDVCGLRATLSHYLGRVDDGSSCG